MFVEKVDDLSVYLGDQAGDTSGTECFIGLDLRGGIPTTTTLNSSSIGCLGRFLTLKTTHRETLSLCVVKIYGFCPGSLILLLLLY